MSFADAIDWAPDSDGVRTGNIPEDWLQGRTAYGGLVTAVAANAMQELVGDRPCRALSVSFVGPTGTGPCTVSPEILRQGRSVTQARVTIAGDNGVATVVSGVFGAARSSVIRKDPEPLPDVPPPEDVAEFPYLPGITPNFVQHIAMGFTSGGIPFTNTRELEHAGWCRHRTDPGPTLGALLGLLDAWPSPALQSLRTPAPASSVTWSAQIVRLPAQVTVDDWFWFRARVVGADGDGFHTMRGELFDRDGLLAHMEQLVATYD